MKKITLLKIINLLLLTNFISIVAVVFLRSLMPPEIFYLIHPKLGYSFIFLLFFHVGMNWNWIKSNFLKRKKK
ncbi:hypothetical protein [Ilyobacter polytropus]|uniref:DUF4405 domain-containing protein n=1 Tax=Ilyobacter polytropus (strain ATCC 51220 / DSM 2926 / LMG 16218 / CuHBu1) TaxID=572544 RepID=E3HDX1_ILYPC|nr:hypothetical protein [Ilyobacter polytropus]ADO84583.1 conserved hypothetical protein [Ilyobacter polytropus DSM 2926]